VISFGRVAARTATLTALLVAGVSCSDDTSSPPPSAETEPQTAEPSPSAEADGEPESSTASTEPSIGPTEPPIERTDPTESSTEPTNDTAMAPRVIIDTDLGGDPDDIQSLIRAIHYSDVLRIEGIVSTQGAGDGKPWLIREWIRRTDVDHLRGLGYEELTAEERLLAGVRTGTQRLRPPSPDGTSDGSQHIIERARAGSPDDPLWLLAWGSLGTIAQALHDDPSIVDRVRIYSIGDYNTRSNEAARDFVFDMLDEHPDLWWIENGVLPLESRSTFRGVWRGGEQSGQWNREEFVDRHIRGHGTDADGRFDEVLGDAFPLANSPREAIGSLKEGDSPSLLYLLSPQLGGPGDLDDPTGPSWGGRFRLADDSFPNYYVDLDCDDKDDCQATINRHRVAYLSHWRDRWDRYDTPADE